AHENSAYLNKFAEQHTGAYTHAKPSDLLGQGIETAGSFLPAVIGGEASIPARLLTRVGLPAAGATLGGNAFPDSADPLQHGLHIGGQVGGAVLGGVGGAGAIGGIKALIGGAAPET